jgi:hypothetical protein
MGHPPILPWKYASLASPKSQGWGTSSQRIPGQLPTLSTGQLFRSKLLSRPLLEFTLGLAALPWETLVLDHPDEHETILGTYFHTGGLRTAVSEEI